MSDELLLNLTVLYTIGGATWNSTRMSSHAIAQQSLITVHKSA